MFITYLTPILMLTTVLDLLYLLLLPVVPDKNLLHLDVILEPQRRKVQVNPST